MMRISILATFILWCGTTFGAALVPKPVSVEKGPGTFILTPATWINYSSRQTMPLADYLADHLRGCKTIQSMTAYTTQARMNNHIYLELAPDMPLPDEGYRITVTENRVKISGKDYGGLFNGVQTFLQLLPPEVYDKEGNHRNFHWQVEGVIIEDYPQMHYRGVMLDVARTFIPKKEVMRFIDNIAYHKINKLHWHLADDEGWRIEIKSYPKLHETGGFRGGDSPVKPIYGAWNERYGGYYTQAEIREIVSYAAVRNIEVIPEIDLPGHSRAAAIAYPGILCAYKPDLTATAGYDRRNVWCVAEEKNYEMLGMILKEVAALFPSERIHLGGDEVEPGQWSHCPDCKRLMAEKGIVEASALEDVFMERAVGILRELGREPAAWVESTYRGKLDRSALVYSWKGDVKIARKAAASGYPTIVMPGSYFYFDMRQSQDEIGHIWAGIVPPEKVYSFDFEKEGFTAGEMENVVGIEAAFFSELLLPNGLKFLDYQMFPRTCALAELTWSRREDRLWSDFEQRLANGHNARMKAMGIGYRTEPGHSAAPQPAKRTPAVAFTSNLREAQRWPFSNVTEYKNMARTTVTCRRGDWFLWQFATPLNCETIRIGTGYSHLQRAGVPLGHVEACYDGKKFELAGELRDGGEFIFRPKRAIHAVRVVSETEGNGEPFVIIQPLEIR